ncbi:hypothetical protein SscP1EGY_9 [Streptomyces phage SscP1EGY]|nr:hypothetical protein SscP1EGY_9 [Streptomyces phage SscP1EGY]
MTDIVYADNFDTYNGSDKEAVTGVTEVFQGTEDEVLAWLEGMFKLKDGDVNSGFAYNLWVKVGESNKAIHVASYLDPKQRGENRNTQRKKFDAIRELVRDAMLHAMYPPKGEKPGDPERMLNETTEKIMKLYS